MVGRWRQKSVPEFEEFQESEIIVCDTCGKFWQRGIQSDMATYHAERLPMHKMHYADLKRESEFG